MKGRKNMRCSKCNEENVDGAKFCNNCGESLINKESENLISQTTDNQKLTNKKKGFKISKKKIFIIISVIVLFIIIGSTGCDHNYSAATCTESMICSLCGKEKGAPLGHDWTEATCLEAKKCSRCDEEDGDALGHDWKEATCEEAKTCNRCLKTEGEALGHEGSDWTVVKKATCTEKGTEKGICIRCNKESTREVKKLKHKEGDWEIVTKATNEEKGKRQKKCTVCNEIVKEEEYSISKAEYKAQCATYSYNTIARNPDKYKGEYGKFYGKVIQVMEENLFGCTSYTLRIALNGNYSSVILATYFAAPEEDHILEDDYITIYGEIEGTKTYETVMGNDVTIPYVDIEYLDIH